MRSVAESWTHKPFTDGEPIPYRDRFSAEEYAKLGDGLVPEAMEDKWFVYFDAPFLYLHRSWTGDPVYRVEIVPTEDGAEVAEALCATDVSAWSGPGYSAELLDFLVGNLLLDKGKPFPMPGPDPSGADGILQHVIAGTGYKQVGPARGPGWASRWPFRWKR